MEESQLFPSKILMRACTILESANWEMLETIVPRGQSWKILNTISKQISWTYFLLSTATPKRVLKKSYRINSCRWPEQSPHAIRLLMMRADSSCSREPIVDLMKYCIIFPSKLGCIFWIPSCSQLYCANVFNSPGVIQSMEKHPSRQILVNSSLLHFL